MGGLRYTDEETMGIVQQVLAGQVNKDLVALLKGPRRRPVRHGRPHDHVQAQVGR